MKTRMRSTKLLGMTVALAALGAVWAVWGARPAKAIIIIDKKTTNIFTVAQNQGVRVYALNAGGEVGIIDDGKATDIAGNTLMGGSGPRRLEPGKGTLLLDFMPLIADGVRLPMRVEVRSESDSSKSKVANFLFTAEVYDTTTGKTDYSIFGFNPQPEPPVF